VEESRRGSRSWSLALGAILLLSLWLRWPLPPPAWSHFDEESLILLPLGFWGGDLNPHFFNYPALQFYLLSALYYLYFLIGASGSVEQFVAYRFFVDGSDLQSIARGLGTAMSVGTVAVSAFLGRRLYGAAAGLAAGFILALMPLSVRFAHLAGTDTPAVLWIALALAWAIRVRQRGVLSDYILAGLFVGLAGATKYPAALSAVPVAVAALLRTPSLKQAGLWCSGGIAILVFSLTSPFVLLDSGAFWEGFSEMGRDHLLTSTSRGTGPSWLYHLQHTFRYGLGIAGTAILLPALIWKRDKWRHEEIILVSGIVAFSAVLVAAESVFMRYALPLTPFIALFTARLVGLCGNRIVLLVGLTVLAAEPAYTSLKTRALLSGEDTRERAADWLLRHAPSRRLVHQLGECGNIQVLTPHRVHVRQTHFQRSYDDERIVQAYDWLADQTQLPPLYLDRTFASLSPSTEPSSPGETSGPLTESGVVLVRYEHPLCPPGEGLPRSANIDTSLDWVEASFSPGPLEAAVFDEMDWYFLPIGRFGEVERTGPPIRLGSVSHGAQAPVPSTNSFFALLARFHAGRQAMVAEDWEAALYFYQPVLRAPIELTQILPAKLLLQLYGSTGLAYNHVGRFREALEPLRQAISLNPREYEAYDDLALAYANLGQLEEAILAWETVIELEPKHGGAYFNLAKALFTTRKYDRAYAVALRGLELTPNHPMAESVRRFVERGG
jgi:hypothetical protein